MSAHTPGRLVVCEYASVTEAQRYGEFGWASADTFRGPVGSVYLSRDGGHSGLPSSIEASLADARRLAACWNAAHDAGLSTEALEQGVVGPALDALRKTLAAAHELHAQNIGCPDCPPDHEDTGQDCPMLVAAEAALARAEGRS